MAANPACQSTSVPKQSKVTHRGRVPADTGTSSLRTKEKGPSPCSDDGPDNLENGELVYIIRMKLASIALWRHQRARAR
jgi:hypothetical protein